MRFSDKLSLAGINKAELARKLGLKPNSVSSWGDNPKRYADTYVELLIEHKRALDRLVKLETAIDVLRGGKS